MYVEFNDVDLYCDNAVSCELDKYLNILNDNYQRSVIEKKLMSDFSKICEKYVSENDYQALRADIFKTWFDAHPENFNSLDPKQGKMLVIIENVENNQNNTRPIIDREICMQILMECIGANIGPAHSRLQCELAMKMFRANKFQRLNRFDRVLIDNLDEYDRPMVSLIIRYRFGDYFRLKNSSCNVLRQPKALIYIMAELKSLYTNTTELKILESIMYYGDLFIEYGCDEEMRIITACKLLSKNNLDYFKLTFDVFFSNNMVVMTNELFIYAQQIDGLSERYKVGWEYFFYDKIPSIDELQNIIFVLACNVQVSELEGGKDLERKLESSMWRNDGFSIEYYIKKGFRTIEKLRFIRFLLNSNINPDDCGIEPDMTLEEMKVCLEVSLLEDKKLSRRKKYIDRGNDWYSINGPSKR